MKNLKENAMMQEMNLQEMKEVNGGLWVEIIIGLLLSEAFDRNNDKDFEDGCQAARDFWGN